MLGLPHENVTASSLHAFVAESDASALQALLREGRTGTSKGALRLRTADNIFIPVGDGFPSGFDPKKASHTGLELIESLGVWDLRGTIIYENRAEGGARVAVTFPLPAP